MSSTPPPADQPPADERFEHFLGSLLRVGVFTAAAVVLIGGVVFLTHHYSAPVDFNFSQEPDALKSPQGIVSLALQFNGRGMIQLGILLLIATPVTRVIFSVIGFARERDFTYVVLTLIVLTVLLYSLFFEGP